MALQTRASAKGLLWKSTAVTSSNISRISSRGKLNIGEWGREPIKDIEPRRTVLVRVIVDTVDMAAGSKQQSIVHDDGDDLCFARCWMTQMGVILLPLSLNINFFLTSSAPCQQVTFAQIALPFDYVIRTNMQSLTAIQGASAAWPIIARFLSNVLHKMP